MGKEQKPRLQCPKNVENDGVEIDNTSHAVLVKILAWKDSTFEWQGWPEENYILEWMNLRENV